jgi:hypothetical protein
MPEGTPGGGDDEYRSVVFDESFVKAARIQEYSARERLDGASRAVRIRHVLPRGLARQAVALILLIVVAFGFAVYMGVRHPYRARTPVAAEQLQVTVIPLVPMGRVPPVSSLAPFDGGTAEHYRVGQAGITVPAVHRVGGYAQSEVDQAFETAKEYLTDSGLNPKTVVDGDVGAVRNLLDPGQLGQFDASLSRPAADGRHEATGWLVRFDPAAQVRLVTDEIRVQGTLDASQTSDNRLEIAADHTFVYALRGPRPGDGVSLFTVRRQLRFRFDHDDLRQHHIQLVQADVAAGPLACTAAVQRYFRPILAGDTAPGAVSGADPYDHNHPVGAVCAPLTGGAAGAPNPGGPAGTGSAGNAGKSGSAAPSAPPTPAAGDSGGAGGVTTSAATAGGTPTSATPQSPPAARSQQRTGAAPAFLPSPSTSVLIRFL